MLSFDDSPLGPLRPSEAVLPGVIARGRQLRRRRRIALTAPIAAVATPLLVAVALLLTTTTPPVQHLHTPAGAPTAVPVAPTTGDGSENPSQGPGPGLSGPGTGGSQFKAAQPATPLPGGSASASGSASPSVPSPSRATPSVPRPGSCDPNGLDAPPHPTCWPTDMGPQGNDVTHPAARGCVVHNTGAYTSVGNPGGFFCSYDAIAPGGYNADGPFNIIRIQRGPQTIDINGFTAARCAPIGLIHPGDHVYIDGRSTRSGGIQQAPTYYTTLSAGDSYHC